VRARRRLRMGYDTSASLHVYTEEVWWFNYVLTRSGRRDFFVLSLGMFVDVYLNGEEAVLESRIQYRLDRCDDVLVWESIMIAMKPYIREGCVEMLDKTVMCHTVQSASDPWKVREALMERALRAVSLHTLKLLRMHGLSLPTVPDEIVESLFVKLPHLIMQARTMVPPVGASLMTYDVPRRGCLVSKNMLDEDGISTLRTLTVWRHLRRRSFNKLLRTLARVKRVRYSWDEVDRQELKP
jgi:hypothetical protein